MAPGASPWAGGGGLRSDGRYVVTTESHVLTLDPATGAVLDAAAWPEPMAYTELFRVWPDGRVSRDAPDEPATRASVFDPRHPERGDDRGRRRPVSFSPDGSRLVLVRRVDGGTDLRVARDGGPGQARRRGCGCRRSSRAPRGRRTAAGSR